MSAIHKSACKMGIFYAVLLGGTSASLAEISLGSVITLDGGSIEHLERRTIVENAEEQVSFPYIFRADANSLWMQYMVGTHGTPSERSYPLWSLDNGLTWEEPTTQYMVGNATRYQDGRILAISGWDLDSSNSTHQLGIIRYDDAFSWPGVHVTDLVFPFQSQLAVHRSVLELESGRIVATAYGRRLGSTKDNVFTFASDDGGTNWFFLSELAASSPFLTTDGWNEPTMVQLKDDSLLMLIRTGHSWDYTTAHPLIQSRSTDGGLTWSDPTKVADFGVDPHAIVLSDGTLVASSGRPGVYLLVDYTGTGDHWQEVSIYDGVGSSYTSLVEIEPNVVMLVYAQSGFEHFELPDGAANRLVGDVMRITTVPTPNTLSIATVAGLFMCMQRRLRVSIQ